MPPSRSTAGPPEHPATLTYPPSKCPSSSLHARQAPWPEGSPVTFPVLAGRTAQTPRSAILPGFRRHHRPPPAPAHLHGRGGTHVLSPNTHNRWHLPGLPNHSSSLPAPPPAPQSSSCARPRRSLTFEVLGVAPRRPARVSSGQRGDTGEVVTHGIRPQGVRRSRGPGEAGQERRHRASVRARAGANRRGRALARLRPGAGGLLLSSPSPGSAVLRGSCPPRGLWCEPPTCPPSPAAGAGAAGGPLGPGRRPPGLPPSSGCFSGSGWWWAAWWLPRAPPGP